jgi:hypothetical protein
MAHSSTQHGQTKHSVNKTLACNSLGDLKVLLFYIESRGIISWQYITGLYNIKKGDILNLGNKLQSMQTRWLNSWLSQFSFIYWLRWLFLIITLNLRNLKLEQFKDGDETAEFILKINNMFDILNFKSKFGKSYKGPITLQNLDELHHNLLDTISYLTGSYYRIPVHFSS